MLATTTMKRVMMKTITTTRPAAGAWLCAVREEWFFDVHTLTRAEGPAGLSGWEQTRFPRRPSPAEVEAVSCRARAPAGQSSHTGWGSVAGTVPAEEQRSAIMWFGAGKYSAASVVQLCYLIFTCLNSITIISQKAQLLWEKVLKVLPEDTSTWTGGIEGPTADVQSLLQ